MAPSAQKLLSVSLDPVWMFWNSVSLCKLDCWVGSVLGCAKVAAHTQAYSKGPQLT